MTRAVLHGIHDDGGLTISEIDYERQFSHSSYNPSLTPPI